MFLVFATSLLFCCTTSAFENMNGGYILAPTPNQKSNNWSTHFKDYPGGVEYFEFHVGPITSTYSEVFWTPLPEVNLSDALIQRFKGKGMAVVGVEADQVRQTKDGDVSVPINVAYNHHYGFNLLSDGASMAHVPTPPIGPDKITMHPGPDPGYSYVPVEHTPNKNGLATSIVLGYSNGGEYRKTYKGLAPPFAQIIGSPTRVSVVPMQIDTWNRDKMNLTGGAFVPGIAPKNSFAPTTGVDAIYSGLLECPLTTRIRKKYTGGGWNDSVTVNVSPCQPSTSFPTAKKCFEAAKLISGIDGNKITTQTINNSSLPSGCILSHTMSTGVFFVSFNTDESSAVSCGDASNDIVVLGDTTTNNGTTAVRVTLNNHTQLATITLTGPSDVWYGVGFDTIAMSNSPYTIVVDGKTGAVSEHVLGNHEAGSQIGSSVTTVTNSVVGGVRQVVVTRPLQGLTTQHHTFNASTLLTNIISAYGTSTSLSYHKEKETAALHLWPSSSALHTCVCSLPAAPFGKGTGTIEYLPSGETIGFPFRCNANESVLHAHNPTCDIRTYKGGLSTCHHAWHLLDQDQEVPWPDQNLTYSLKFRVYFQEHDQLATFGEVGHHIETFDITWSIAGATGEYDVPQCKPGTPTEQCTHEITGVITPPGDDLHFVAAHYHCHAPTCLSIEIWTWDNATNSTKELLCKESPYHGKGHVNGEHGDKFDEIGYIAIPICMWGLHAPFITPPFVSGVPLFVKATTNNTYGHHGEVRPPLSFFLLRFKVLLVCGCVQYRML